MLLQFDYLELDFFKSFHYVDLALDNYGVGLHFLRGQNKVEPRLGSNGAGKSSLWDALSWCLYGRTPDGLKGPDVRPWGKNATTNACLGFSIDNDQHEILRQAGPNRLFLDGKEIGQETIDRLIGINVETFLHTIVLGQGQPLFFDLQPRQKMEKFSDVLDLNRWDQRASHAGEKVYTLQRLQAELEGELRVTIDRIETTERDLASLKAQSQEFEDDRKKKLDGVEQEVQTAKTRLEKLGSERDRADLAYDGAMTELKQLDKDHAQLFRQMNEAVVAFEKHDLMLAGMEEIISALRAELKEAGDVCPTCGQPLKGADRKRHRKQLQDRVDELLDKVEDESKVSHKLEARVNECRATEKRLQAQIVGFRKTADEASATLEVTKPLCIELEQVVRQRDIYEQELRDATNPFQDQLSKRRKDAKRFAADKRELEERLNKLTGQIERTKFWTKGFRDVRLYVIDEIIQELELATNALLADVGLIDWAVKYDVEKQTKSGTTQRGLTTTILSPTNDKPVKWEAWSGGERQRLRLVGALAFADVLLSHANVSCNIEVLDEPTRHLSEEGVRDLCDFLMMRAQQLEKAIFYVDHQSVESARFQSVTTVVKTTKGSKLISNVVN